MPPKAKINIRKDLLHPVHEFFSNWKVFIKWGQAGIFLWASCFILLHSCNDSPKPQNNGPHFGNLLTEHSEFGDFIFFPFRGDSGMLSTGQVFGFCPECFDQAPSPAEAEKTIGKYYRNASGSYMVFSKTIYDSWMLMETNPRRKVIRKIHMGITSWNCCWEEGQPGFFRLGDWYVVEMCGSGTGYCSGDIKLFKSLDNFFESGVIIGDNQLSMSPDQKCHFLKGKVVRADSLAVVRHSLYFYKCNTNSGKPLVKNFTVTYRHSGIHWIRLTPSPLDSFFFP